MAHGLGQVEPDREAQAARSDVVEEGVREAILALPERAWQPAPAQDGEDREGAWVVELPLDLSGWAPGWGRSRRQIARIPGGQLSFTDEDGYRFQVFLTDRDIRFPYPATSAGKTVSSGSYAGELIARSRSAFDPVFLIVCS